MNLVLYQPAELLAEDLGSKCWLLRHMMPRCESERCPATTPIGFATSVVVHLGIAALVVLFSAQQFMMPMGGAAGAAGDDAITMVDVITAPMPAAAPAPVAQKPATKIAPKTEFFEKADIAAPRPAAEAAPSTETVIQTNLDANKLSTGGAQPQMAAVRGTGGVVGGDAQFRGAPLMMGAEFLSNPPQPQYPAGAIARGETGQVILRAYVTTNGTPDDVMVWQSSGSRLLDQAALRAVREWQFRAATRAGSPSPAWVQVPVVFRLD